MVSNRKQEKSQVRNLISKYDNILDFYSYYLQPMCPRIGLTLEQFWEDDPELFFVYLEAYNENKKQELEEQNLMAYIQGQYFCLAVAQNLQMSKSPKRIYPDKPFSLFGDSQKIEETPEQQLAKWKCYLLSKQAK